MAFPETLWLSPTSLAKVDDGNYRAFVIDKAQLPHPENQSGSKHLVVGTMASVGINTDVTGIMHAPAPGDTRSGFVTVHLVANSTESAQLNSKKVWARRCHQPGYSCFFFPATCPLLPLRASFSWRSFLVPAGLRPAALAPASLGPGLGMPLAFLFFLVLVFPKQLVVANSLDQWCGHIACRTRASMSHSSRSNAMRTSFVRLFERGDHTPGQGF